MAQFSFGTEMDINSNIILRERPNLSSKANSRSSLISSSNFYIPYYECIELENNKPEVDIY